MKLFINKEATTEIIITKMRLKIIKAAAAKIFPKNTLNLDAGPVRVNFIVSSANSPANISIQINAVKRGKRE